MRGGDEVSKHEMPWKSAESICQFPGETEFLEVRRARETGVGYGWMQQAIEIEWAATSGGIGAWGPHYFETRIRELKAEIDRLKGAA
jgi:hypothetical protein